MEIIARIENDYTSKFGVPRQSGLVEEVISEIVFEKEYRVADALRGIDQFSHLWLIWGFHEAKGKEWSPTVRPPRLGGNERIGVFATRSPYRPNRIGLSCVRLLEVCEAEGKGTVLRVAGADLMNGTPIYDVKPYLPYADCRADATGGFTDAVERKKLRVLGLEMVSQAQQAALEAVLAQDPRPSYQHDAQREYGLAFAGWNVRFRVEGEVLTITEAQKIS